MQTNEVGTVLEAYRAAVYAKDVAAFVALYDEDVCNFDMWGAWSYQGKAAWREMVAGWFGSLGEERVSVDFSDVQTVVSGELAVMHLFVTYRGLSAQGQELRAMQNRMTCTLHQKNGEWKIIHEHTSSPLDFATGQPLLRR